MKNATQEHVRHYTLTGEPDKAIDILFELWPILRSNMGELDTTARWKKREKMRLAALVKELIRNREVKNFSFTVYTILPAM